MNTKINSKKILVTGGTGFLGKRAALRLAQQGYTVTVAARNLLPAGDLFQYGVRLYKMDLENELEVVNACKGHDIVLHCGALSKPWGHYQDFYRTNVLGTKHVIEGCFTHDIQRLIHISTPSLYFDYTDRFNINESSSLPVKPCNAYAATKRIAEEEVDLASTEGLNTITLRPRGIFGPGDTTILPRIIEANNKKNLPIINNGNAKIDMTYVDNVVDAIILSIEASPKVFGKKYNLTNGEPWTIFALMQSLFLKLGTPLYLKKIPYPIAYLLAWGSEIYSKLCNHYNEPKFTRYTVGVIAKSQTLDIESAKNDLGYTPRIGIEEGINRFVKWWKDKERYGIDR